MYSGDNTELLLSEVAPIVSAVFETMLGLEVARAEAAWSAAPDRVVASVRLAGEWNGAIDLECDHRQACRFASLFLSDDHPEEPCTIARDVLGELINMIGGNLKCALASGILLSSPSVTEDSAARSAGTDQEHHLAFHCSEGTFWVGLLSQAP